MSDVSAVSQSSADNKSRSLWRIPGYKSWFVADTSGLFGSEIRGFVYSLLLLAVGGSPAEAAALVSLATLARGIGMFPGGVVQDRFSRYVLVIINEISRAITGAAVIILLCCGWFNFLTAAVISVVTGLSGGLLGGGSNLLLRELVPPKQLHIAIRNNSVRDSTLGITAKPVAGFLLNISGIFAMAVSVFFSVIAAISAKILHRGVAARNSLSITGAVKETKEKLSLSYALEGFSLAAKNSFLRASIFGCTFIYMPFVAIAYITVLDMVDSGVSAGVAGLFYTAAAVGSLCGTLIVAYMMKKLRGGVIAIFCLVLIVFSSVLLIFVDGVLWKSMVVAPAYLLFPASMAVWGSVEMLVVKKDKLGRVFSVEGLVNVIIGSACTALSGILLTAVGYKYTVAIFAAVMTIALFFVIADSSVRNIPFPDDYEEYSKKIGCR